MSYSSRSNGELSHQRLGSLSVRTSIWLTIIFLFTALAAVITLYELDGIRSHANNALNRVLPSAQMRHRQAVDAVGLFAAYHKLLHDNDLVRPHVEVAAEASGDAHAEDEMADPAAAAHAGPDAHADLAESSTDILNEIILRAASLQMSVDMEQSDRVHEVVRLATRVAELGVREAEFREMLHGYVEHARLISRQVGELVGDLDSNAASKIERSIRAMNDDSAGSAGSVMGSMAHMRLTEELHEMSLVRDVGNSIRRLVETMYRVLLISEHLHEPAEIQRAAHEFALISHEFYPLLQMLHESPVDASDVTRLETLLDEFTGLSVMFHDQATIHEIITEKHLASEAVEQNLDAVAAHLSSEADEDAEEGILRIVSSSELTSMLMLGGILLIGACFWLLVRFGRRHIIRPLVQASDALDALCMGDTDVSLPPMKHRELESIRNSLHRFRNSTLELAVVNKRMEEEVVERRRREKEALRARKQTIAAIESMAEGFALYDSEERLVMRNSQHRKLFPQLAKRIKPGDTFEDIVRLNVESGDLIGVGEDSETYIQNRLRSFRNLQGVEEMPLASGRWVSFREFRTEDGGTVATQTDITEQRLAEQTLRYQAKLMEMLREIAYDTNEAINLSQAMQFSLEQVCNYTQFDFGHAYLSESNDSARKMEHHRWFSRSSGKRQWLVTDEQNQCSESICQILADRVTETGEPVWISDFSKLCKPDCHCCMVAIDANPVFATGCAFPVIEHGRTVAVIEFYSQHRIERDDILNDALINLSSQLGRTTERQRSVMALKKLRQAVEQSPTMILITDLEGRIEYANPEATEITGYQTDELIGSRPSLFRSEQTSPLIHQQLWETITRGEEWRGELLNNRRNGDQYWAATSISPVRDEVGNVTHYLGVVEDVTERKRDAERIEHLAHYDVLTELPNRAMFFSTASRQLSLSERSGHRAGLLMMDLDDFKDVNDSLGHATGDLLLQQVAHRLEECLRQGDIVARLGGDEFALLLPEIEDPNAISLAVQRMIAALTKPFRLDDVDIYVSACVGIALFPEDGPDVDTLLKHADLAMYRAKAIAPGSFNFFREEMDREVSERKALEVQMRHAIEREEFTVYYQPQYDMVTQQLCGAEALLRWMHPDRGMVSPGEFIPVAERSGLISPLGTWVLRDVCRQAREWLDQGLPAIPIAVNLSPLQFKQQNLLETVLAAMRDFDLPPSSLHLEITEGVLMQDTEANLMVIQRLIDEGIEIALDDFGTGYSSLSYLRKLPVHKIKIDRSFIIGVQENPVKEKIVRTIAMLGEALGMRVNVEGVETDEEYRALLQSEIHEVQGFLFSRPIPVEEFTDIQYASDMSEA